MGLTPAGTLAAPTGEVDTEVMALHVAATCYRS
jgi:hypothetical protein